MPKPARDVPPPLELMCLSALWALQEGSVRDVQRVVAESRPLAYTTIMTVLERLARKGKVARRKAGRAFVYTPTQSRDALRRAAIRELLQAFFGGSREELIEFLAAYEPRAAAAAAASGPGATNATHASDDRIDTVLL